MTDLTPIASLLSLKKLDLSWTAVTDLKPISGLVNLEALNLHALKIL